MRRLLDFGKAFGSLLTICLPLLERWQPVLPVSARLREESLIIAIFACLLAVVAGYATGRHTPSGLSVGWLFLGLFMLVLFYQLGSGNRVPWAMRPLYVLIFTSFSLSISAFLAYSARRAHLQQEHWPGEAGS